MGSPGKPPTKPTDVITLSRELADQALATLWHHQAGPHGDRMYQFDQLHPLGRVLLEPLWNHIGAYRSLLISPHRHLSWVPFWTLPVPGGQDGARLGFDKVVTMLPSAGGLVHLRGGPETPGRGYLGVGVDGDGKIPLVELEVQLAKNRCFPQGVVRLGGEGTIAVLLEPRPRLAVLHICSHGTEDPPTLVLWGDGRPAYLSPDEVQQGLGVRADVIVLSGCFTGQVKLEEAAEFMGTARGLLLKAGARALVGTLWACGELETTLFTDRLLQDSRGYKPLGEAMRSATAWLATCTVGDVSAWLNDPEVETAAGQLGPACRRRLAAYRLGFADLDPSRAAFPSVQRWGPFFLLGDPETTLESHIKSLPGAVFTFRHSRDWRLAASSGLPARKKAISAWMGSVSWNSSTRRWEKRRWK